MRILSSSGLTYFLNSSDGTLRAFRKCGMPCYKQSKGYTYDLEAVYEWLSEKAKTEPKYKKYRDRLEPLFVIDEPKFKELFSYVND